MNKFKKFMAVIFSITWFMLFLIVGMLDEGSMPCEAAFSLSFVNFVIMGVSGFTSGLLTVPEDDGRRRK